MGKAEMGKENSVQQYDMQEIEQQHERLITLLTALNAAVKRWEARRELYRMIDEVITCTREHFFTEEALMERCGFPGLEAHRAMHRQLVEDTLHFKGKLEYIGEEMFTEWFGHWPFSRVLAHIQYADKQLADYLAQL